MKRLVILGGGESGVGAAILGKDKGMDVFLSDSGSLSDHYRRVLDEEGIPYEEGTHTLERILTADEVVKSPGIPPTAPVVKEIVAKGIPVISEIELAGRYTDARMVCITGSNGKTTTTLLTYHILKSAGVDAGLAGNVGQSLALQVARDDHDVYVIELSSFQLENMYDFHANIAVILNITPDHLDRYDYEMQNYINAKFRILNNLTPRDAFIYWQDDPVIARQLEQVATEATLYPFAEKKEEGSAAWVDDEGEMCVETPAESMRMPRADLSLNGLHNLYNSMAAAISACILDIDKEEIRKALGDFEGVEHRLEPAGTVDGVRYINDSKATNVNSTWYALESMPCDTILILGGKDKGNDYTEILPLVKEKVKAVVCMGKDNTKLLDFFTGQVDSIFDTHSIEEAVATCASIAGRGDTVLLSPCCASFDLFKSYEDRGRQFKEQVKKLMHKA
ncbi:MAG: UDP-N-acetylmuramoyl-L-alanine--D-glutamate ligase [Duncaniella sp.]|nr:UDP-N-acetylmuramoyl-L-alanine--D-glutamate ligase [Duncaniella sp.]MDE6572012.1 UDP-N-acetylmuramoyl-L-alanine--D-glutamate ligase [Duncaniella sp.]